MPGCAGSASDPSDRNHENNTTTGRHDRAPYTPKPRPTPPQRTPHSAMTARSSSATFAAVPGIPHEELRNNIADIARRAESGEEFTITATGRPVAELGPARRRQWISGSDLAKLWDTPAPQTLASGRGLSGAPRELPAARGRRR